MLLNSVRHLLLREFGRLFDWTMSMVGEKKKRVYHTIVAVCCRPWAYFTLVGVRLTLDSQHKQQYHQCQCSCWCRHLPYHHQHHHHRHHQDHPATATIITSGKIAVKSTGDANINHFTETWGNESLRIKLSGNRCQMGPIESSSWPLLYPEQERIHVHLLHVWSDSSMVRDLCTCDCQPLPIERPRVPLPWPWWELPAPVGPCRWGVCCRWGNAFGSQQKTNCEKARILAAT